MLLYKNFGSQDNPLYEFFPKSVVPPEKEIHLALKELLGHPEARHAKTAAKLLSICTAYGENRIQPQSYINHSHRVYYHYRERMRVLRQEVLVALLMDTIHRLQTEVLITVGTFWDNTAQMQEVLLPVLERRAKKFILVHNHPTGNPVPSEADFAATERLKKSAELFDVKLIDHVVIGHDAYYSINGETLFTSMDSETVLPPIQYDLIEKSNKQGEVK